MEYLGYMLALFGFCFSIGAFYKITSLEHRIKSLEEPLDYVALFNLLQETMGKEIKLDFFEQVNFLIGKKVIVLDLDDSWVLLQYIEKKEKRKCLVQLNNIKNITILTE